MTNNGMKGVRRVGEGREGESSFQHDFVRTNLFKYPEKYYFKLKKLLTIIRTKKPILNGNITNVHVKITNIQIVQQFENGQNQIQQILICNIKLYILF